jgi:hypothetical protein
VTGVPPELDGYTLASSLSFLPLSVETVRVAKDGWFLYQSRPFIEDLIEDGVFELVMDAMFADLKQQQEPR